MKHAKELSIRESLTEIVNRIVEVAQPDQIILFGSAARREMTEESDIDLLVVKSNTHRRHLAQLIYQNLIGVGVPVDIIVATPEDLQTYQHSIGLIYEPALTDGEVIYDK